VFEERYQALVAHCLDCSDGFGVTLIRHGREVGGPAEPFDVGTMARIAGYARLPDGRYLLEVEGARRFQIRSMNGSSPYPMADVAWLPEPIGNFGRARALSESAEGLMHVYRARNGDGDAPIHLPVDPVARSYVLASLLKIDACEKQRLLEAEAADERLEAEVSLLEREIGRLDGLRSTK
jgi:hypothetical protein